MKYISLLLLTTILSGCIATDNYTQTTTQSNKAEQPKKLDNFDVFCSNEKGLNALIYDYRIKRDNIDLESYNCSYTDIKTLRESSGYFIFSKFINGDPDTCKFIGVDMINGKKEIFPIFVWSITEKLCTNYTNEIIN